MKTNTHNINQSPLYKLSSRKKLAHNILKISVSNMENIANKDDSYEKFDIKQGNKSRRIEIPKPALNNIHKRIFFLLKKIEKPDYLQSGIKDRSYITNAKEHATNAPIAKIDIQRFFPSISKVMVYNFFRDTMKCSQDISAILAKLCTCDNHVPTGSCISQSIAYYSTLPLFERISKISTENDVKFTLYVDDMTFSGNNATPEFLWEIKKLIHSFGLKYHKCHFFPKYSNKFVTGVLIRGNSIKVRASKHRMIWEMLEELKQGPSVNENRKDQILGHMSAAGQIEPRFLETAKLIRTKTKFNRVNHKKSK